MIHGSAVAAVNGVSFNIPRSKTLALVGESGSGKSVTAQAILRILPSIANISGEIWLNDCRENGHKSGHESGQASGYETGNNTGAIDIAALNLHGRRSHRAAEAQMRAIRGGRIAMIFQEPMVSLSPLHTVGNQVCESVLLHQNVDASTARKRSRDMLDRVGFPDPDRAMKTYPFELSGGLRQRAMIATALVCKPDLLIADEPTTALDVTIQAQILKLISDLQADLDMSVLLITHDLGVVANVADEVVVMYHGEIVEAGSVTDIYRHPQHPYLKALMAAIPHFDMQPGERLVPVREIDASVGELYRGERAGRAKGDQGRDKPRDKPQDKPHLVVSGISKSFAIRNTPLFGNADHNVIKAVDNVSFAVNAGECFGLVGESGCGKTTLSKILMKALPADSGSVIFHDVQGDVQGDGEGRGEIDILALEGDPLFGFRRKMQFIFQDPFSSLNPRMTVLDIITEPLIIHGIGDQGYRQEMAKELMRLVGLDQRFLSRYPHSFSGGQRQRLGIARALALKPDLIICDEPVSALDVSIQAQILNLLKDLREELQLTTLFISHNLAVVDYIAERIAVMAQGRLVEMAPKALIFNNPIHPYTKALLGAVPFPDLDRPLDFDLVMDSRSSDPNAWAKPFNCMDDSAMEMVSVEKNHYVRQRAL